MVVIFAQNISIVSSGMSPRSQLGHCPQGLVDSTLLSSLMTILEPRGSFRVKYLEGGGKDHYSMDSGKVGCGLGFLSKSCCTQIQM